MAGSTYRTSGDCGQRWEAAVSGFERFGNVFELARSRTRLAAVLRAAGDAEAASRQLQLARTTAHRAGGRPADATRSGPSARPAATPSGDAPVEALTPREVEVLALVAEGRTNGEIGRQLFISTKTVSVHVSNILAKLGATAAAPRPPHWPAGAGCSDPDVRPLSSGRGQPGTWPASSAYPTKATVSIRVCATTIGPTRPQRW